MPASDVYLKWVHPAARKVLKDNAGKGIEYIQGNLANEETRQKVFLAPGSKAFDIVFDLSQADASVSGSEEALIEVGKGGGGDADLNKLVDPYSSDCKDDQAYGNGSAQAWRSRSIHQADGS